MDSGRLEGVEERARRVRGVELQWYVWKRIHSRINTGHGVRSIAMSRIDFMCLCIAMADDLGAYRIVTELFGVPIFLVEEFPEGMVVVE